MKPLSRTRFHYLSTHTPSIRVRLLALCFALFSLGYLGGCTHVEPWQRGKLAKEQMMLNPQPLQNKLRTHVHNSREGASSGDVKTGGGGCGCY